MRRSFALRLGAAFAGVGIAAAALTAILVNVAFGSRFTGYLDAQQEVREQQLVAILADSYSRSSRWVGGDLSSLTPLAFMDGVGPSACSTRRDGPCGHRARTNSWVRWRRCTGR
jgi:hypothetical protein